MATHHVNAHTERSMYVAAIMRRARSIMRCAAVMNVFERLFVCCRFVGLVSMVRCHDPMCCIIASLVVALLNSPGTNMSQNISCVCGFILDHKASLI